MVESTNNLQQNNNPESDSKPEIDAITDALNKVELEETKDAAPKTEQHKTNAFNIVGMRQIENKTIISDLTSQKSTWNSLGVPEEI